MPVGARVCAAYDEKSAAASSFAAGSVTLLEAAPQETHTFEGAVTDASMKYIRFCRNAAKINVKA